MKDRLKQLVQTFGSYRIQKGGEEYIFKCPECQRWKLSYNPKKEMLHPCFRCSFKVKLPRLIKKIGRVFERKVKEPEDQPIELPEGLRYADTQASAVRFLKS